MPWNASPFFTCPSSRCPLPSPSSPVLQALNLYRQGSLVPLKLMLRACARRWLASSQAHLVPVAGTVVVECAESRTTCTSVRVLHPPTRQPPQAWASAPSKPQFPTCKGGGSTGIVGRVDQLGPSPEKMPAPAHADPELLVELGLSRLAVFCA